MREIDATLKAQLIKKQGPNLQIHQAFCPGLMRWPPLSKRRLSILDQTKKRRDPKAARYWKNEGWRSALVKKIKSWSMYWKWALNIPSAIPIFVVKSIHSSWSLKHEMRLTATSWRGNVAMTIKPRGIKKKKIILFFWNAGCSLLRYIPNWRNMPSDQKSPGTKVNKGRLPNGYLGIFPKLLSPLPPLGTLG